MLIKRVRITTVFSTMISASIIITFIITLAISMEVSITAMDQQGKILLKNSVVMLNEMILEKQNSVRKGEISEKNAQFEILKYLKNNKDINLGENGYFIILNTQGEILFHPTLEGANVLETVDYGWQPKKFVREQIEKAKRGGDYTYFKWKYTSSNRIGMKVVYSLYIPEWDWVIESSGYLSDYREQILKVISQAALPMLITIIAILVVLRLLVFIILKPINLLAINLKSLSGNQIELIPNNYHVLEMRELVDGFNYMALQIKSFTETLMEKNRVLSNNMFELQALYEEAYAQEETLRENYDQLIQYKITIDNEKTHYRLVLSLSEDIFIEYNPELGMVLMNNLNTGNVENEMSLDEFINKFHIDDQFLIQSIFSHELDKQYFRVEHSMRFESRPKYYEWYKFVCINYEDAENSTRFILGSLKNIHNEFLQKEKIHFFAFHDAMTGLYNGEYLNEILTNLISQHTSIENHLIVFSISNFDRIQSIYGTNLFNIIAFQISGLFKSKFSFTENLCILKYGVYAVLLESNQSIELFKQSMVELKEAIDLLIRLT